MFGGRRHGRGYHGGGHHRRHNMALFLLFMQMAKVGFDRIPPVTLFTILGQVAAFLKLFPVPSIGKVCISAVNVWYKEDWSRLFTAAFFHLDEWHLYYNMASFLSKGISLERRYGSFYMAYLIAIFAVLCNATTVALSVAAEMLTDDPSYLSSCAAGFSGVIFALKVVTTHLTPPGTSYVMGFLPVPSRYACWVELLAIQFIVPNASFVGHLAGILVGVAYVKGPLKMGMDTVAGFLTSLYAPPASAFGDSRRFTGGGRSTGAGRSTGSENGSAPRSGHRPAAEQTSEDEQMQEAIRRSLRERYDQPRATPSAPRATPSAPTPPSEPRSSLYPDLSSESPTLPPRYESQPESPPYSTRPNYPVLSDQSYRPPPPQYPDHPPPPYPGNTNTPRDITQDEVRRRRLKKFQR